MIRMTNTPADKKLHRLLALALVSGFLLLRASTVAYASSDSKLLMRLGLQVANAGYSQEPDSTTRVYQDRVRFAAPAGVKEWRVEVFGTDGRKLFSSGFGTSAGVDWNLQDLNGQPVGEGLYSYQITIKDTSGTKSRLPSGSLAISENKQTRERALPIGVAKAPAQGEAAKAKPLKGEGTVGQIWVASLRSLVNSDAVLLVFSLYEASNNFDSESVLNSLNAGLCLHE